MKNKIEKIVARKFIAVLTNKGLLNGAGVYYALGVKGEDEIFAKWIEVARGFVFKDIKVEVDLFAERVNFDRSYCYPVVRIKD